MGGLRDSFVQTLLRSVAKRRYTFFLACIGVSQVPQQTGVPLMVTQEVQPAVTMQLTQSQQAWIIWQQLASPLVQVMHTPVSVISHLHMPIVKLQAQTVMPFIVTQQPTTPPASIVHRFWTMPAATLSSQTQWIFTPP